MRTNFETTFSAATAAALLMVPFAAAQLTGSWVDQGNGAYGKDTQAALALFFKSSVKHDMVVKNGPGGPLDLDWFKYDYDCRKVAALTPPAQIFPPEGAVLNQNIPHFEWQRSEVVIPNAVSDCEIQIMADENEENVIDQDRIAGVIGWCVPDRELPPGHYPWRVAAVDAGGRRST